MSVTLPVQETKFKLFGSQTQKFASIKALLAATEEKIGSQESFSDQSDKTNLNSTHGF